jgi:hypothetical protein
MTFPNPFGNSSAICLSLPFVREWFTRSKRGPNSWEITRLWVESASQVKKSSFADVSPIEERSHSRAPDWPTKRPDVSRRSSPLVSASGSELGAWFISRRSAPRSREWSTNREGEVGCITLALGWAEPARYLRSQTPCLARLSGSVWDHSHPRYWCPVLRALPTTRQPHRQIIRTSHIDDPIHRSRHCRNDRSHGEWGRGNRTRRQTATGFAKACSWFHSCQGNCH